MRRIAIGVVVVAGLAGMAWWAKPLLAPADPQSWYARTVYPLEHVRHIRSASRRNSLDPALVAAIIYAESRFDEDARSPKGAVGLMQVLPDTAEQIARETGGVAFVAADLEEPDVNIRYGCYYLRTALEAFGGDTLAAVASYNAGIGAVEKWRADALDEGHRLRVNDIPYAETRAYVRRVLQARRAYRDEYGDNLQLSASQG